MARFRVKGESVVLWELELDAKNEGPGDVDQAAKEYVHDMLDLPGIGRTAAKIDSQDDRVLRWVEIDPLQGGSDAEAVE
jgi:hypothetical protein